MTEEPQSTGDRERRARYLRLAGGIAGLALFGGVILFVTGGGSDERPDDDVTTNEGPHRVDDAERLCGAIDWSVLDDAYEYEDSAWRDELEGRDGHYSGDDGTGAFSCGTNLPVAGITGDAHDPIFSVSIMIVPTADEARESFDEESEFVREGEGTKDWEPLSIDEPERCDDVLAGVHEVQATEGTLAATRRQVNIGCLSGNAVVSVQLTGFDVDDGTRQRDAPSAMRDVLLPIVDRVFSAMSSKE